MTDANRSRILDLAIASIEQGGETSIRVNHLAAAAGVTPPVVYYHFENREGLIVAAQTERYTRQIRADFEGFIEAIERCRTAEEFRETLSEIWRRNFGTRATSRWIRLNALGSAYARSRLEVALNETLRALFISVAEALKPYQDRGWLRPDIDLISAIAWQHGVQLSRVFVERGIAEVDLDEWDRLTLETFLNLAFGKSSNA